MASTAVFGDGRLRQLQIEGLTLERIGEGGGGVPEGAAFLAELGLSGSEHLDQLAAALVIQLPEE
jgi:hypothetical protein